MISAALAFGVFIRRGRPRGATGWVQLRVGPRRRSSRSLASRTSTSPWQGPGAHQQTIGPTQGQNQCPTGAKERSQRQSLSSNNANREVDMSTTLNHLGDLLHRSRAEAPSNSASNHAKVDMNLDGMTTSSFSAARSPCSTGSRGT